MLNPIYFIQNTTRNFLQYQLTAYPFSDSNLHDQMRALLSLDETQDTPLLKGPYVTLSQSFREGVAIDRMIDHPEQNKGTTPPKGE